MWKDSFLSMFLSMFSSLQKCASHVQDRKMQAQTDASVTISLLVVADDSCLNN